MNVLVIVAHPDDETLGMGGTIRKHADRGDNVIVLAFCKTRASDGFSEACRVLGARPESREFFDQELETYRVQDITEHIDWREPDLIYTHNPDDLNRDHRIVCEAVLVAFRPPIFRGTILAFETISSTEWGIEPFQPNWYEELTEQQVDVKCDALACYASEVRYPPNPRNGMGIYALARVRGAACGVGYAEAFRLLRRGPG